MAIQEMLSPLCVEHSALTIDLVIKEDDGLAWIDDDKVVINARWLTNHPPSIEEIVEEINRSVIHEIIEHIIGLEHRHAVYAETIVYGSPWYRRKH